MGGDDFTALGNARRFRLLHLPRVGSDVVDSGSNSVLLP
jgi:hypothetical protein